MQYKVLKVYNNNVVLALKNEEEAILISKGIGFGRKQGELVMQDQLIEKVFYQTPSYAVNNMNEVHQKIEKLSRKIIQIAELRIGKLNEHVGKVLAEHIEFAIERLKVGIKIDNPFIDEIMMLYEEEYEIAQLVGKLINEKFNINIGEEEEGFIALHIYSARENKDMKETMKRTKFYKETLEIIEETYHVHLLAYTVECKEFLRNLDSAIRITKKNQCLDMKIKEYVKQHMKTAYIVALEIAEFISHDVKINIPESLITLLAIDIDKLIQLVKGDYNERKEV